MKLSLLPKKTRGEKVVANLTLRFGDETSLKGRQTAAQNAGGMLMRGTNKHTRQQLSDAIDKLKARANVSGSGATARPRWRPRARTCRQSCGWSRRCCGSLRSRPTSSSS